MSDFLDIDSGKKIDAAADGLRKLYGAVLLKDGFNEEVAQAYILYFRAQDLYNMKQLEGGSSWYKDHAFNVLYDKVLGEVSAVQFDRSAIPLPFEIRDPDVQKQDIRRHNRFDTPCFSLWFVHTGAVNGNTASMDIEQAQRYFSDNDVATEPSISVVGKLSGLYVGERNSVQTLLPKEFLEPDGNSTSASKIQDYLEEALAYKVFSERYSAKFVAKETD